MARHMNGFAVTTAFVLAASGCASYPHPVVRGECIENQKVKPFCISTRWSDYESGPMFCAERYQIKHKERDLSLSARRLAAKGYLYALAAAKVLHKDDEEGRDHSFADDPKLVHQAHLDDDNWTGFQASVYEKIGDRGNLDAVVISFRGSDEWRDWTLQNVGIPMQYSSSREMVKRVKNIDAYRNIPLVVTGASLGGGLAAHVRQSAGTRELVSEAWLFNPSVFDGILFTDPDEHTYMLYQEGEFLEGPRALLGTNYAPPENTASFGLMRATAGYAHFRYALLLQILHAADVYYWCKSNGSDELSPALKLLEKSSMRACNKKTAAGEAKKAKDYISNLISQGNDPFSWCK